MKRLVALGCIALISGCQSVSTEKPGFSSAFPASQWSRSGMGGNAKYRCKVESCGGPKTTVTISKFYGSDSVPELGLSGSSDMETAFRNKANLQNMLSSMMRRVITTDGDNQADFASTYFANSTYVGYRISGYSPKSGQHVYGELRIDGNELLLIGASSQDKSRVKPLFGRFVANNNL